MLRFPTYQIRRVYEENSSSGCTRRIFFVNPPSFRSFGPFDKWGIRLFRIKKGHACGKMTFPHSSICPICSKKSHSFKLLWIILSILFVSTNQFDPCGKQYFLFLSLVIHYIIFKMPPNTVDVAKCPDFEVSDELFEEDPLEVTDEKDEDSTFQTYSRYLRCPHCLENPPTFGTLKRMVQHFNQAKCFKGFQHSFLFEDSGLRVECKFSGCKIVNNSREEALAHISSHLQDTKQR